MYHILYQITNTLNGKIYVGVHSTDNLNDDYMGSGSGIKQAIKKYGVDNFTKTIIQHFQTAEDAYTAEASVVNEAFVARPDTYNNKVGGVGWTPGDAHRAMSKAASMKARDIILHNPVIRAQRKERLSASLKQYYAVNTRKPRVWLSKDDIRATRYIPVEESHLYLADGWYRGKIYHNHKNGSTK